MTKMGRTYEVKNIVEIARSRIGQTIYRRGVHPGQWPALMDCSGFTKWSYGQLGIWLPRYSIDQRDFGKRVDGMAEIKKGDLVFASGYRD